MIKSFNDHHRNYVTPCYLAWRNRFYNRAQNVRQEDIYFHKKQDDVSIPNVFSTVPS